MMAEQKWNYGGAIDRFPIKEGETWRTEDGKGTLRVHDIYNPLPDFMYEADMVIVDPPWNLSNVNTFYTKADKKGEHKNTFHDFYEQIFKTLESIDPNIVYMEMGKQNVDKFAERFRQLYEYVQVWEVTYYNTQPCFFIRASKIGETDIDFTGVDELKVIAKATEVEDYNIVADFVMGRGAVAVGAYEAGKKFVGTELNPKRLAVVKEKIDKLGGKWKLEN